MNLYTNDWRDGFGKLFFGGGIMKKWLTFLLTILVFFAGQTVFAQSVRVGR